MRTVVTAAEVEAALAAAVPGDLTFHVERSDGMICVVVPQQQGVPWEIHVGWEGVPGHGEHLLWIVSDPLKYEEMWLEDLDSQTLDTFARFVNDLLEGRIAVELTRFRSSGKLWRTRLIDHRRPAREQVVYSYYRSAFRWWRPVLSETVKVGSSDKFSHR